MGAWKLETTEVERGMSSIRKTVVSRTQRCRVSKREEGSEEVEVKGNE